MPKPRNLIPTESLHCRLPADAYALMHAHLYSPVEGRVPQGDFAAFLSARIREYFSQSTLDLAPYTGQPAGLFEVRGTPQAVELLRITLER